MVNFQLTAYNIALLYCFVKSILKVFEMKVCGFRFRNGEFDEVSYHVESVSSLFKDLVFTGYGSLFIYRLNYVPSKEEIRSGVCFFPFLYLLNEKITTRQLKKIKELWQI